MSKRGYRVWWYRPEHWSVCYGGGVSYPTLAAALRRLREKVAEGYVVEIYREHDDVPGLAAPGGGG